MESTPQSQSYSSRIQERLQRWWGDDLSPFRRLHRLRELTRLHAADDPDAAWRCCSIWQRTLSNKLNGKAFAQRLGVPVNVTYWHGRRPTSIPWERIPPAFVIKPVWGGGSRGVCAVADERDPVRSETTTREAMIGELARARPVTWIPLMVEERAHRPDGSYGEPLEYRFHVFRDRVEAVSLLLLSQGVQGFFSPEWERFPDGLGAQYIQSDFPVPEGLEEMIVAATRLGTAYGTYVRADIFWTDRGLRFNEFASCPARGRGITAFADDYLGACWERMLERFPEMDRDDP